jgi:hypothetical protein
MRTSPTVNTTSKKVLAALRRWKLANPEKVAQQKVRWRARHPNYMRDWRRRNPDKIKDYRTSA